MTHRAPYLMGKGVEGAGGRGGRGKGEFEQTEIPEHAGEVPACFVLVTM